LIASTAFRRTYECLRHAGAFCFVR
jgi:hypothetical protein